MRRRTLFAIVLTLFALPALAADWPPPSAPADAAAPAPSVDTLVAIADVRLDAALDEKATVGDRDQLLEAARLGYEKAIKTDPKSKAALRGMAQFYARTESREKALEFYRKCLTLHPDADLAHEVAIVHARWKDPAAAVAWCEYALKLDPDNRGVRKTLGFCLAHAGNWDEAFAVLCRIMPEAQARYNLAGLLARTGRTEACEVQLRLALRADPTHAPARDMLRALAVAVAPMPREAPEMVTKVFDVYDLVIPAGGADATRVYHANAENLVKLVTEVVRPTSWRDAGGHGSADFFDIGTSLVVRQSPAAAAEAAALIDALHRLRTARPAATVAELHAALLRPGSDDPAAPRAEEPKAMPAQAQPVAGVAKQVVYKVKHIDAADAARALFAFASEMKLTACVAGESGAKAVVVCAAAPAHQQFAAILRELDKDAPQVIAQVIVVRVPRGFAARAGLNVGAAADAKSWTLSPREAHMFRELMHEAKGRGECDVLARPAVRVCDNQTGSVRVGQQYPVVTGFEIKTAGAVASLEPQTKTVELGVTLDLTPRVAPDGKSVRLATDFRLVEVAGEAKTPLTVTTPGATAPVTQTVAVPTFLTSAVRATAELPFGHTLVLAASATDAQADAPTETLVLVTPALAQTQEAEPTTGGWFVK